MLNRTLALLAVFGFLGIAASGCVNENAGKSTGEHFGILPVNYDDFEDNYFENFSLVYLGSSTEIQYHRASITNESISGERSLKWAGAAGEEKWMFASNAFWTPATYEISVKIKLAWKDSASSAGLMGAISEYSLADGIIINNGGVKLFVGSDQHNWPNGSVQSKESCIGSATNVIAKMRYEAGGVLKAQVEDTDSGEILAQFEATSQTPHNAVGFFVHETDADDGFVLFDDMKITTEEEYSIPSGVMVRSPQFMVLPRPPDVDTLHGSWVGGHTMMIDDGVYKIWYRIRLSGSRGAAYGYAESIDGIHWKKHDSNVITLDSEIYSSCEKISVLKIDGVYKAWYTVNVRALPFDAGVLNMAVWNINYAESQDGINWVEKGAVLSGVSPYPTIANWKDPCVIYKDGLYYCYFGETYSSVGPGGVGNIYLATSSDGQTGWTYQMVLSGMGSRHPAVFYSEEDEKFYMYYHDHGYQGIKRVESEDGMNFENTADVLCVSPVGLDDNKLAPWSATNPQEDGVDYPAFAADPQGHLEDTSSVLMFYQARHGEMNNEGAWKNCQDCKVVLAGNFTGLYEGVRSLVMPNGSMRYYSFPINCNEAENFAASSDSAFYLTVSGQNDGAAASWTASPQSGGMMQVQYVISGLDAGAGYTLLADGKSVQSMTADSGGKLSFSQALEGEQEFVLKQAK